MQTDRRTFSHSLSALAGAALVPQWAQAATPVSGPHMLSGFGGLVGTWAMSRRTLWGRRDGGRLQVWSSGRGTAYFMRMDLTDRPQQHWVWTQKASGGTFLGNQLSPRTGQLMAPDLVGGFEGATGRFSNGTDLWIWNNLSADQSRLTLTAGRARRRVWRLDRLRA